MIDHDALLGVIRQADPVPDPEATAERLDAGSVLLAAVDNKVEGKVEGRPRHLLRVMNDLEVPGDLTQAARPISKEVSARRLVRPVVAVAAAVVAAGGVWLFRGSGSDFAEQPMPAMTTAPSATLPRMASSVALDADEIAFSMPGDETFAVAVGDGSLWTWTALGIVRWDLEERRPELFMPADDLPFGYDMGIIAVASDGSVWASNGPRDQVARFDGARWSEPAGYDELDVVTRCTIDTPCEEEITAMAVGPAGLLSLALGDEALLQFDGNEWRAIAFPDWAGSVDDLVAGVDGTLWMIAEEVLLTYDGGTWDRITPPDGLAAGGVGAVAVAPNGDVWVGNARFDGESWTVFDETDGLYDDGVDGLTIGPDGTVWLLHNDENERPGVSRFDGTAWSTATFTDIGVRYGFADPAVYAAATGTLWIASEWGAVGFDGSQTTVLRYPDGLRSHTDGAPATPGSRILPSGEGPLEWRWEPDASGNTTGVPASPLIDGCNFFPVSSASVPFGGGAIHIDFKTGLAAPDIAVTHEGGAVTEVGNPFGEYVWLCSVAANETRILSVGSGVWWSDDGIAWNRIEAFDEFRGWRFGRGSNLIWAAAGPGGYLVLGEMAPDPDSRESDDDLNRVGWFSEDLTSWYEIPLEDGAGPAGSRGWAGGVGWGWYGPSGVGVGDEVIIEVPGGVWVGSRRTG